MIRGIAVALVFLCGNAYATRRPLSDAVIVAVWRQVDADFHEWAGIFRRIESRTDANGHFTISRWGPRPRPLQAYLDSRDPELWVMRRGYLIGYFDNRGASRPRVALMTGGSPEVVFAKMPPGKTAAGSREELVRAEAGGSRWNGKTLELQRAASPLDLAESIAAASPIDPRLEGPRDPIPLFWAEWNATRDTLPEGLKGRFTKPMSTIDMDVH